MAQAQVTFIIKSLPNTTPEEDTLFISGTFNNWLVNDKNYILHQQLDGKYVITLSIKKKIEFKFTRGNWSKVETNRLNKNIPNRIYRPNGEKTIAINIENWLDLGGAKKFNYIIFILFALALYSLTLVFFVARIPFKNKVFFRIFVCLNSLLFFSLFLKITYIQLSLIWQSRIVLFGFILLFLWSPCFYQYFVLSQKKQIIKKWTLHYFPVLLVSVWFFLRIINFNPLQALTKQIYSNIPLDDFVVFLIGIALNVFYLSKSVKYTHWRLLRKEKLPPQTSLLNKIFLIDISAILWILISSFSLFANKIPHLAQKFDIFLILLSGIIFIEFYFYWKYPKIVQDKTLKQNKTPIKNKTKKEEQRPIAHQMSEEEKELMTRLLEEMVENKIFKDPDLNISKLAKHLGVKKYILSKLINEHISKSFRDFINEYRINEFIELATSNKYKKFTFLALGYEVGFNSKSTFNLTFKKITGFSPSEYLKKEFNIEND